MDAALERKILERRNFRKVRTTNLHANVSQCWLVLELSTVKQDSKRPGRKHWLKAKLVCRDLKNTGLERQTPAFRQCQDGRVL